MKNSKRLVALMLLVVTIFSVVSVSASASNWQDTDFYNFTLRSYQRYLNPRAKEDTTPCYVKITAAAHNQTTFISANGCYSSSSSATRYNCTRNGNGYSVAHVSILPYQGYLVRSMIYENKYPYASLGFSTPIVGGNEVSGVWSPDSVGSYPYAY